MVFNKFLSVAEAPECSHGKYARTFAGLHIRAGITDIKHIRFVQMQLFQNIIYAIRRRFSSALLALSHKKIKRVFSEDLLHHIYCTRLRFVGVHCQMQSLFLQGFQKLPYPIIRLYLIHAVFFKDTVIRLHHTVKMHKLRIAVRDQALADQFFCPVSRKILIAVDLVRWQPCGRKCHISRLP